MSMQSPLLFSGWPNDRLRDSILHTTLLAAVEVTGTNCLKRWTSITRSKLPPLSMSMSSSVSVTTPPIRGHILTGKHHDLLTDHMTDMQVRTPRSKHLSTTTNSLTAVIVTWFGLTVLLTKAVPILQVHPLLTRKLFMLTWKESTTRHKKWKDRREKQLAKQLEVQLFQERSITDKWKS